MVVLLVGATVWFAMRKPQAAPAEKLQQALELLRDRDDLDGRQRSRELAIALDRSGYRDPDFAGGVEFVLGIVAFRTAQDVDGDEDQQEKQYLFAVKKLRECEQFALIQEFRPEWSYALGVSLHELGNSSASLPLLQEALATYSQGRNDAAMRLIESSLDRKKRDELQTALKLTIDLLQDKRLTPRQRDRVYLNKSQLHLALKEYVAAQTSLRKMSNTKTGGHAAQVFRARTRLAMADAITSQKALVSLSAVVYAVIRNRAIRQYRAAQSDLLPVANAKGLETIFPRQARYLMGICAQKIAEFESLGRSVPSYDSAINLYGQTARDYPQTHEAVAASLRSGELLRLSGRDEESLQSYRRAIRMATRSREYHNRWISRAEMRAMLLQAWNAWMDRGATAVAIDLSAMMSGIIPKVRAQELNAIAHAEWAKRLATLIPTRPASEHKTLRSELIRRRRLTGDAYAKLAILVKTTSRYTGFLKLSAQNYHEGHDFENALKQQDEFINTRPEKEVAQAIVRRGRILMDLNRLQKARDDLQLVRNSYPTDHAAFEAMYLLGVCQLELGNTREAEAIWRSILSSQLRPAAVEWRLSLFSLGRHLFHTAKLLKEKAGRLRKTDLEQAKTIREQAAVRWGSAIRRLQEYIGRYPRTAETNEVRFLVARALQYTAGIEGEKRDEGEVENVRNDHRRRMNSLLKRAQVRYRLLQSDLLKLEENERLDEAGQSLLRDCYFEIAHCHFSQEEYDKAIVAYTNASNRYSKDAQVLLAYFQMANCYDRLGDSTEAMSLIIQAEVILKLLSDKAFNPRVSSLSKREWEKWLKWAKQQRTAKRK